MPDKSNAAVMAGLVPAIRSGTVLTRMAGTSPAMTVDEEPRSVSV
jgi:hypothetical protein